MILRISLGLGAAAMLAACAEGRPANAGVSVAEAAPASARRLTAPELLARLPGHLVERAEPDFAAEAELFEAGGRYTYLAHRAVRHAGTWRLVGDEVCVTVPSQPRLDACRGVWVDAQGGYRFAMQGPGGRSLASVVFKPITGSI